MASQPQQPSSTNEPPPPPTAKRECPIERNLVVLCDWWVERMEGGGVRLVGIKSRSRAVRMFSSARIKKKNANGTIDTVDDLKILLRGPLNIPRMHQNGFPHEVSKYFQYGFPAEWEKYTNPNMEEMNKETPDPSESTEYDIEKFLRYCLTLGIYSRPPIFRESTVQHGASSAVPSVVPAEKCSSGEVGQDAEDRQGNVRIDVCEQENIAQHGSSSAGPSVSNQQEYHIDHMPSDLEDCKTPKCCKTVHLGAEDALQVPMEGTGPHFGVVQGSENTFRRLRSGKVYEMSNALSVKKRAFKRDIMPDKTLNMKMGPYEEVIRPADMISHENVGSVPVVATADKLQLHDSRCQDEEEAGKRRRKCKRYGQLDHNQKTCKKPVNDPLAPTPALAQEKERNIERIEAISAPKLLSTPSKAATSKAPQSSPVTRIKKKL